MIERDINVRLLYGKILIHIHLKTLNMGIASGKFFYCKTK
jgi:hypothetical protein